MNDPDQTPKPAAGANLLFMRPSTYELLRKLAAGGKIAPDPHQFDVVTKKGVSYFTLKGKRGLGKDNFGGSSAAAFFPELTIYGPEDSPTYEVWVTQGDLTNLATGTAIAVTQTGEALEVEETDKVWLEATIEEGLPTTVKVNYGEGGWEGYPKQAVFSDTDPYQQTFAYFLLGELGDVDGVSKMFRPHSGNLRMMPGWVEMKRAWVFG